MCLSWPASIDTQTDLRRFSARDPLKTVVYACRHNGPFRGFSFVDGKRSLSVEGLRPVSGSPQHSGNGRELRRRGDL